MRLNAVPDLDLMFRANHPETVVYCQSSNALLKHAIDTAEGRSSSPLRCSNDDEVLPPMPQRGEVDFIYGGKWNLLIECVIMTLLC